MVPAALFRTFRTRILTSSSGPASGSRLRCTTMPLSVLFTKCALPLMSYSPGASPRHC